MASIKTLVGATSGPALSVYFPLGPQEGRGRVRSPAMRLRTLAGRAEQALRRNGVSADGASTMVGALVEIADGLERDQHNEQGFGYFATQARSRMLSLPVALPELLEVGGLFYVKPLLSVIGREQHFHVLALDSGDARLYAMSPLGWDELPLDVLPDLLDEPVAAVAAGARGGDLPGYVRGDLARVAEAARVALAGETVPVLLAAPAALARYVRQLGVVPNLHPEALTLDPFALTSEDLHARALGAMRSVVDAEPEAVVARATRGRARKDVGTALEDILARARAGQVEVVVVAEDVAVRGAGGATQKASAEPDLLNEVAVETLRGGGRAFALASARMPAGMPAVALYRA